MLLAKARRGSSATRRPPPAEGGREDATPRAAHPLEGHAAGNRRGEAPWTIQGINIYGRRGAAAYCGMVHCRVPKMVANAKSLASRPVPMRKSPMRGEIPDGSKIYQRSPR